MNPAGKLTSIVAGMMCGADCIDDVNVLRAGGTPRVFDEVYAPSTLGIFLREFTFGHANQLAAVARAHLVALAARVPLLAGIEQRAFVDIDSLLRPVYGHAKQGASFGHAKIAGRALLRRGLSPQITTISTATAAPVIAEARLRSGKAGSGRAAARQVKQAITTARKCGAGTIMVRGDSAFGTKKVIAAGVEEDVEFSLWVSRTPRITAAIAAIDEASYTPVHYPGAVEDPDTGALISDAEVAETPYTLRLGCGRTITGRLVVRRVKDARYPDGLFPVWRYHPFVTNSDLPTTEADLTHRRHAIIETTFADLIDGRLAHIPSGLFSANCAWLAAAVIAHNLLRAAGTLAGGDAAVARGATLRRDLVNVPARFTARHRPAGRCCTCPPIGHDKLNGKPCGTTLSATRPRNRGPPDPTGFSCPPARPGPRNPQQGKAGTGQQITHAPGPFHLRLPLTNPATTAPNHPSTESGLA